MLTLKVITAVILFLSVLLRTVMDYLWKDKRTNRYRYTRNAFIGTAVSAACLNGVVLWVDEVQKAAKVVEQQARGIEVENISIGGLTPDVFVELYTGPNSPTPPRMTLNPPYPGVVAVWIDNTNSYPIYDVEVYLWNEKGTNHIQTETAKKFNSDKTNIPIVKAHSGPVYLLPADLELPRTKFSFQVRTRRGSTRHETVFELVGDKWEYARMVTELTYRTNRVLLVESSAGFPKSNSGSPLMQ